MKNIILALIAVAFIACAPQNTETSNGSDVPEYLYFGEPIDKEGAISLSEVISRFSEQDSFAVKISGVIDAVCQKKGCWMTMMINDDEEMMVKFKDYDFFIPMDVAGKEVIIDGYLFREVQSVDEQRHYAEDAEMSTEDIEKITVPKEIYSFEASGVLIKQ
jgi:hypothetical protein